MNDEKYFYAVQSHIKCSENFLESKAKCIVKFRQYMIQDK
jgi:hypothetical protein